MKRTFLFLELWEEKFSVKYCISVAWKALIVDQNFSQNMNNLVKHNSPRWTFGVFLGRVYLVYGVIWAWQMRIQKREKLVLKKQVSVSNYWCPSFHFYYHL